MKKENDDLEEAIMQAWNSAQVTMNTRFAEEMVMLRLRHKNNPEQSWVGCLHSIWLEEM